MTRTAPKAILYISNNNQLKEFSQRKYEQLIDLCFYSSHHYYSCYFARTSRAFVKLFLPMIDNNNQYIHKYIHTYIYNIYIYISYFCSVPTIQGFIITCWEFKTIMIINMIIYWWFFFYFSYNFVILSVNVPCIFSNKKLKI